MPRRLVATLTAVVGLAALAPLASQAPLAAQAAPEGTVGIRIVDAPSARADDPRARLYIVDHVAPGTTIRRRVEVRNTTAATHAVQLYAAAADVVRGAFTFGEGRAVNELSSWTEVDPSSVSLAAGGRRFANVTIAVPADASAGERYGVVWAELRAEAPVRGGAGAVNRVGVRIYLSVGPGGEPASDFEITALQGRRDAGGRPAVAATVRNTGGRALDLSGDLRLSGGPGGLSAGPFAATLGTTLGLRQSEPVLVSLDEALPAGPWDAVIVLRSGTTVREASASITFPDRPASASPAVKPESRGRGGPGVVALALVGALLVALLLLSLARRRRDRTGDAVAAERNGHDAPSSG